jgi:Ca-activated chloride channel family protein
MTFLSGWRLVFLIAPILLAVAYVVMQRRRHSDVARFTNLALIDSVAPTRSGWQRHVPAVALLGSLVVMTLAFAQPALAIPVAKDRSTILLALDTSASMTATDVAPNRLQAAEAQARTFISGLPEGIQVGLVTFDSSARLVVPPTADRAEVTSALDSLGVGGGTATAAGIRTSLAAIAGIPKGDSGKPAQAAIVLMSDGTPTVSDGLESPVDAANTAAQEARAAGVPIDTIAFGTQNGTVNIQGEDIPVPTDVGAMATIADQSGGRSFTAETADQLGASYSKISHDFAYEIKTQEVTALFAGLGLLLAVAAAVAALVWTQRLV